jgi:tetratricopeptide (TPR) repeat protein
MSLISGIESIALVCLIKSNNDLFMLHQASLDRISKIFDNVLKKSIEDSKADISKSLLTSLNQDKNIKSKINDMVQKGDFFSTENILPSFQKNVNKDFTSNNIEDILKNLNYDIKSDKSLNEELEKIYLQILVRNKKWDLAYEYYLDNLEIYEDNEDKYSMAKTHNNIGDIYQAKGEWNKAIGNYSKALELYENLGDINGMANCWGSLGIVHQAKEQPDKAIECYTKSLDNFEKDKNNHGKALTLNNLGLVHQDKGDLDKAAELFTLSWEIFEKDGDLQGLAQSRGNLSMLAFAKNDHKKAIKQFFEILFLYIKMESEEQVNQAFSIIKYLTNQLESKMVQEIFKSVQAEISKEGVTWGTHSVLTATDVQQIYSNLSKIKSN